MGQQPPTQQPSSAGPQIGGSTQAVPAAHPPPPQLEVGAGQSGTAPVTGHQATPDAMEIDSTKSKAPETSTMIVPSVSEVEIPESSDKGAHKSKGNPFCYRCRTKGHTIHGCTVVLCCEICFGDHVTKLCHNLKKTNVNAIPCGYAVEGSGFYYIPVPENSKVSSEEKLALVRVLEGSFTVQQLAVELKKLLPEHKNHNWGIETKGVDSFVLNFPSASFLEKLVN